VEFLTPMKANAFFFSLNELKVKEMMKPFSLFCWDSPILECQSEG